MTNLEKWVETLRSDEFTQARHRLRTNEGYCCLGVACELYRREHLDNSSWFKHNGYFEFEVDNFAAVSILPIPVSRWLFGVDNCDVGFIPELNKSLTELNDTGSTFKEIADIIERTWVNGFLQEMD